MHASWLVSKWSIQLSTHTTENWLISSTYKNWSQLVSVRSIQFLDLFGTSLGLAFPKMAKRSDQTGLDWTLKHQSCPWEWVVLLRPTCLRGCPSWEWLSYSAAPGGQGINDVAFLHHSAGVLVVTHLRYKLSTMSNGDMSPWQSEKCIPRMVHIYVIASGSCLTNIWPVLKITKCGWTWLETGSKLDWGCSWKIKDELFHWRNWYNILFVNSFFKSLQVLKWAIQQKYEKYYLPFLFGAGFLSIEKKAALKRLDNFNVDFNLHGLSVDNTHFNVLLWRWHATPDWNSENSESSWTWDLVLAYVLCHCCSLDPKGWKRSGQSVKVGGSLRWWSRQ